MTVDIVGTVINIEPLDTTHGGTSIVLVKINGVD